MTGRAGAVVVCDYGAGNLRSVLVTLGRVGRPAELTSDPARVRGAALAVLPGVGAAGAAMRRLAATGLDAALAERVAAGDPVLGICLGLQLALDGSEEDGGTAGLGIVPGRAVRLTTRPLPRLGWAVVDELGEAFYFAHSYAADSPATVAWSEGVAAILRHGSFTGVQFHPEKSGPAGARWLDRCLSPA